MYVFYILQFYIQVRRKAYVEMNIQILGAVLEACWMVKVQNYATNTQLNTTKITYECDHLKNNSNIHYEQENKNYNTLKNQLYYILQNALFRIKYF